MLEEIKKIKLEELNKEKVKYDEKRDAIKQRLNEIRDNLWQLQGEQSRGLTVRDDFSFIEKWIFRRKEYKKFKEQSERFYKLPILIDKVKSQLNEENKRVEQELEASGIYAKLNEINQSINSLKNAKTLFEIGITPIDAIKLLENNGIQPVLSESDKNVFVHPIDYSSKSSLIGVHKTKCAPTANMIKSAKDSNVEYKKNVTLNGVEYEYSYKSARDTVHMAMNDEVSSHMFGSWDNCKYAILIPFDDIPNEKIGRVAPMDTFTRGSIELSENSWILCPKNEVERLKIFNPKVHVLGYEGENVTGYSKPFLTQLGYRGEDVGMWSWLNRKSANQFCKLMQKEGLRIGTHTYTYFHEDAQKGGPIDVYKEFTTERSFFRAGLEFETGNISSAHRSMNKLCVGIKKGELDLAILMMPIKKMSFYLTDRVSNYEELEPYFLLLDEVPFIVFGFDAEEYSADAPLLPKGKDGMSPRTIRKWQNK